MSWSVSSKVKSESDIQELQPTTELGEGAGMQLEAAKKAARGLLQRLNGEEFNVSLSGHSQADVPGSAPDSISVSIYGIS